MNDHVMYIFRVKQFVWTETETALSLEGVYKLQLLLLAAMHCQAFYIDVAKCTV